MILRKHFSKPFFFLFFSYYWNHKRESHLKYELETLYFLWLCILEKQILIMCLCPWGSVQGTFGTVFYFSTNVEWGNYLFQEAGARLTAWEQT